uniref:Polymerase ACIDIC PROTEIN-DEPENDENT, RNA polymerase, TRANSCRIPTION n=1 Tax=Microviridae sp. ctJKB8 TaxID=2824991 RepID=A0A8S5URZ3_9VIRU|nr:MAG TPA: polymerase ACIDIC PROTEIN-DEPENDENT, RNA polymerase, TRANSCRIPTION [Microviridae sp. ctJKB8]
MRKGRFYLTCRVYTPCIHLTLCQIQDLHFVN